MSATIGKRLFKAYSVFLLCFILTGADYLGQKKYDGSRNLLGTPFQITVFNSRLTQNALRGVVEKTFDDTEALLNQMSSQNPDSSVSKINQLKSGDVLPLDEDTFYVLYETVRVLRTTGGGYDFTDGALLREWAKAKESAIIPTTEAITPLLSAVSYKNIELNEENKTVKILKEGVIVNIDEIAKGYAIDRAIEHLKASGVLTALVATDSMIRTMGLSQEGRLWRFGIEHPRRIVGYAAVVEMESEKVIATVGDYDNFFISQGKRYPLLLDPRTGMPPDNHVASVSVLAGNAAFASILGRVFFVLGPKKSFELVEKLKGEGVNAIFFEEPKKNNALILSCSEGAQVLLRDIDV